MSQVRNEKWSVSVTTAGKLFCTTVLKYCTGHPFYCLSTPNTYIVYSKFLIMCKPHNRRYNFWGNKDFLQTTHVRNAKLVERVSGENRGKRIG